MPKTLPIIDISAPVCCAPVAAGPMSDADALQVALRLKALADPARVKIMSVLFGSTAGEENSGELAAVLGLTESTVSHHLSQLRKAGLVESERRGMNVYHRPSHESHRRPVHSARPTLLPMTCVLPHGTGKSPSPHDRTPPAA
jgi:ArsR family transcriptional regulator, arsenate/arsenite/antimonite-responsive transcriptional repressor